MFVEGECGELRGGRCRSLRDDRKKGKCKCKCKCKGKWKGKCKGKSKGKCKYRGLSTSLRFGRDDGVGWECGMRDSGSGAGGLGRW